MANNGQDADATNPHLGSTLGKANVKAITNEQDPLAAAKGDNMKPAPGQPTAATLSVAVHGPTKSKVRNGAKNGDADATQLLAQAQAGSIASQAAQPIVVPIAAQAEVTPPAVATEEATPTPVDNVPATFAATPIVPSAIAMSTTPPAAPAKTALAPAVNSAPAHSTLADGQPAASPQIPPNMIHSTTPVKASSSAAATKETLAAPLTAPQPEGGGTVSSTPVAPAPVAGEPVASVTNSAHVATSPSAAVPRANPLREAMPLAAAGKHPASTAPHGVLPAVENSSPEAANTAARAYRLANLPDAQSVLSTAHTQTATASQASTTHTPSAFAPSASTSRVRPNADTPHAGSQARENSAAPSATAHNSAPDEAPQRTAAAESAAALPATPVPQASSGTQTTPHAAPLAAAPLLSGNPQTAEAPYREAASTPLVANTAAPVFADLQQAHLRVGTNASELKVSVQLPELGRVEVRAVSTGHGQEEHVTAHVTAQRLEGAQALVAERNGLEQSLRTRDVMLGSLGSFSQHQSQAQQQNPQPAAQSWTSSAADNGSSSEPATLPLPVPEDASISVLA